MNKLTQKFPVPMNIFYTVITLMVAVILTLFNSEDIIVPTLGAGLVVYAFYQLYRLLLTKEKTAAYKVLLIEVTGQVIIGALLVYIAIFAEFSLGVFFGYLLGGLLIIRGTLFLYASPTEKELGSFLIHVAAIIAGTYLIIQGDFTAGVVSGIIIAVALKRSIKTAYKAYKAYQNTAPKVLSETVQPEKIDSESPPKMDSIQWKE